MATGVIHDLGYKRYVGTRRPQSTRWQVVTHNLLSFAWKRWWRYKVWLGIAFVTTVVLGAIMVLLRSETLGELRNAGILVRLVDGLVFGSSSFYSKIAFLLSLTVGIGVVASDLRTGAFTFYFARPVRPMDYVIGKLVALIVLQGTVFLVPQLILCFVRLGLSDNTAQLVANLAYVPKAALVGAVGCLTFASVSLAFSAAMSSTKLNLALWAAYYLIISTMAVGIAQLTKTPALASIDIAYALRMLSAGLFGVAPSFLSGNTPDPAIAAPVIALLAYCVGGVAFAYFRVKDAAHAGIGGGS